MSSRRPWRLVLGLWGSYWVLLAVFGLGPFALAVLRATRGPETQTSSVNVNFGSDGFTATVVDQGTTTYSAAFHLVTLALWIAGPPLLAWLAVAMRSRREAEQVERV